ncbi:MAG: hypothetical protein IRZ33_10900 [Alicyclobacillaceae bacterium]|nr:hypothetical protein [Alicyclobacillaceae bacterium]
MKESLVNAVDQVYREVRALVDIVQGQLALLSQTTGVLPELEQGFVERRQRVAAVMRDWHRIAEQVAVAPCTEELNEVMQKVQLAVQLFLELDTKLVEQLNERASTVMQALDERRHRARGLARYNESLRVSDGVTEMLLRNRSRWIDQRG